MAYSSGVQLWLPLRIPREVSSKVLHMARLSSLEVEDYISILSKSSWMDRGMAQQ
jgi:hypothetical protein